MCLKICSLGNDTIGLGGQLLSFSKFRAIDRLRRLLFESC